ncbi:MAG: alpha-amylase/4-alpha-glucanotransferase domain-containing protein [Fidelibacterota bacterium]
MKSVQFIFGVHNHQPIGNFDHVFEHSLKRCYEPFIGALERHPTLAVVIHFSGCLLEWLEEHYPDFLGRVKRLVERGNIELLAAGFYEPVLAVIPDQDKVGQINKMRSYLAANFNYDARGLWLTERVWEPHLAKPIREAGIDYLTVDDHHFLATGKSPEELTGYYNTDDQGYVVSVFPINQPLRYAMPFEEPEVVIDFLREKATENGEQVVVMVDDGEKFGVWPGTYERCYGKTAWLERMFTMLEEHAATIKTTTFKAYHAQHAPRGRVYLPSTSYFEMGEWTLPARSGERFADFTRSLKVNGKWEQIRSFIRGGIWRNFQSIYEESNWMQKRMIGISRRLHGVENGSTKQDKVLTTIRDDLWRAQCNCAYWHGIFGGLYLPHLRHAIYTHLLKAEQALDRVMQPVALAADIDGDGATEYSLQSETLKVIVSEIGGCIREFDILPKNFNVVNTMSRYRESYHRGVKEAETASTMKGSIHSINVSKEPGLEAYLHFDRAPRWMLMDHFLPPGVQLKQVRREFPEQGNLMFKRFERTNTHPFTLIGHGAVNGNPVTVQKKLLLTSRGLRIEIAISNEGNTRFQGVYGCELNFSLLGGHTPDRYYEIDGHVPARKYLDAIGHAKGVRRVALVDAWDGFRVTVDFPHSTDVWRFPVETVSKSEAGFEKVYQSSVVMPHWLLILQPHESQQLTFVIQVTLQ